MRFQKTCGKLVMVRNMVPTKISASRIYMINNRRLQRFKVVDEQEAAAWMMEARRRARGGRKGRQ